MDVEEHFKQFQDVIARNDLSSRADELADYITGEKTVCPKVFAKTFSLSKEDTHIFLSWIHKGLKFKKEQLQFE